MNNLTAAEMAFRCKRLSVRIERSIDNFVRIGTLSLEGKDSATTLEIVRESKLFLELTAIDLDFDRALELAQIQRQLSRWHIHWLEYWNDESKRLEISTLAQVWAKQLREMAGVFV